MSWDPSQKSLVGSSIDDPNCIICLEKIVSENQAPCEGEKPRVLDCSHIFHRECIGSWLVQKHNCPLCRAPVRVDTPEARPPEMSFQEIRGVPDHQQPAAVEPEDIRGDLFVIRQNILEIRRVRLLNLNVNTPQAGNATKIKSFISTFTFFNPQR